MPLEKESELYESIKNELLEKHEGKYVLIVGGERLGIFDSADDAYRRGIELKGNVPMLIQQIEKNDRVEAVPAMVLGLIYAHL